MSVRTQARPLSAEGKRKINKMFAHLRSRRVEARQNFSCCNTCGAAEMARLFELEPDRIGYVFYHSQNAASLHEEQGTYLAFGAAPGHDSDEHIGRMIVAAAHEYGLFTRWDGSADTKVYVSEVPVL